MTAHGAAEIPGKYHLLYVTDTLCQRGGAERALLEQVRWALQGGFRCTVITFRGEETSRLVQEFPCPVKVMTMRRSYGWNALQVGMSLARFIRDERVDIVQTSFPSSDLWAGMIAKLCRRPLLVSSRRDVGIVRTAMHRVAYRWLRGIYDRVVTVSEEVRRAMIAQDRLAPADVQTIYNAVAEAEICTAADWAVARASFGLQHASHVITTVGNLRRVKGLDVFLRCAALLRRRYPDALFCVAGDETAGEPGYLDELRRLSAELGVEAQVRFLGAISDVDSLLKVSDVFCLLSRSEGFSNALLEAMACGVPCVASRVGGNGEALIDGRTGWLVDSEDAATAAECVHKLLESPAEAKRIGAAAQCEAEERFSPQRIAAQWNELYKSLLAERAAC